MCNQRVLFVDQEVEDDSKNGDDDPDGSAHKRVLPIQTLVPGQVAPAFPDPIHAVLFLVGGHLEALQEELDKKEFKKNVQILDQHLQLIVWGTPISRNPRLPSL